LADAKLEEFHPGFTKSPSVMLHRFGTDPEYKIWRLKRMAGVEFADMAKQGGAREMQQVREMVGLKPTTDANAFSLFRLPARGASRVQGTTLLARVSTLTRWNPPPLFGVGLIDSISDEVIRAAAGRTIAGCPEVKGRAAVL
jgi:hypothetical protein